MWGAFYALTTAGTRKRVMCTAALAKRYTSAWSRNSPKLAGDTRACPIIEARALPRVLARARHQADTSACNLCPLRDDNPHALGPGPGQIPVKASVGCHRASLPQWQAPLGAICPPCSDHAPGPQRRAISRRAGRADSPPRRAARLGASRGRTLVASRSAGLPQRSHGGPLYPAFVLLLLHGMRRGESSACAGRTSTWTRGRSTSASRSSVYRGSSG